MLIYCSTTANKMELKLLRQLLKASKVTTEHQKGLKTITTKKVKLQHNIYLQQNMVLSEQNIYPSPAKSKTSAACNI